MTWASPWDRPKLPVAACIVGAAFASLSVGWPALNAKLALLWFSTAMAVSVGLVVVGMWRPKEAARPTDNLEPTYLRGYADGKAKATAEQASQRLMDCGPDCPCYNGSVGGVR